MLFSEVNRDTDSIIFKFCDALSLWNLRRCNKYLYEIIPKCCYRQEESLFINDKPIGKHGSMFFMNEGEILYHSRDLKDIVYCYKKLNIYYRNDLRDTMTFVNNKLVYRDEICN